MYLLNIDQNAKTVKGQKYGYMTAVMYLAPFKIAGINVCPMAVIAGCWRACLNESGRGGMAIGGKYLDIPEVGKVPDNPIQRARIKRTQLYAHDRERFLAKLDREIGNFIKRAKRKGLIPAIRLNGTSDIQWERVAPWLFEKYADVQFYDYTKIYKRFERELPRNYHLTLSYSEANQKYADACWHAHREHNASLVIVYRDKTAAINAHTYFEECRVNVIDGDAHDIRFIDKPGSIVTLKAKGPARKDDTGFVIDFE